MTASVVKLRDKEITKILAFDLEWSLDKDKFGENRILAAGFYDSARHKEVYLLEDFLSGSSEESKNIAEKSLLARITNIINQYDWSVGFYSTGIRAYNSIKNRVQGRDSDLIQLHRRLERYSLQSPIRLSHITGIPYIVGESNCHTHLDAYRIFSNQVIRISVYNGAYNSNDLDTISRAILGRNTVFEDGYGGLVTSAGKYNGLSGSIFESLTSEHAKKGYVLRDAMLLMNCIAHNNYEILKVLNSLANLTGLSFRDVCNSRGVTKIWTPILDTIVEKEISALSNVDDDDIVRSTTLIEYLDKKIAYEEKKGVQLEEKMRAESYNSNRYKNEQRQDRKSSRYIGGWVMEPVPGEYRNIMVFDITSLYPTIIVNNNISFETVDCICCEDNNYALVPDYIFEIKTRRHICTKYTGILKRQISEYMSKRIEYKQKAKELFNINREQTREYDVLSNAYKILINSAYGQLGHKFSKYENLKAAELVTRYGRYIIKQCIRIAREMFKWDVIYGDTDSIFVNNSDSIIQDEIKSFRDTCKSRLDVDMELDKVYYKLLITGSKNYVGIIRDNKKLIVNGLAGKKSDRCLWVRNAFKQMLEDYKNDINPCIRLRKEISKLENDGLENAENQLIIFKNLNKSVDEYKVNVIQKLIGIDKNLQNGDTVRYYMSDTVHKYTYNYTEISKKEYKKQLINTVKPILSLLGYNVRRELEQTAMISIRDIPPRDKIMDRVQERLLIQI
jgi:DNA polymerase, archaea type